MNKSQNQNICVLSFEDISLEYRVRNQLVSLSEISNVDFIGLGDWQTPKNVNFIKLAKNKKDFKFYFQYFVLLFLGKLFPPLYEFVFNLKQEYREASEFIANNDYRVIHANDWDGLFIAVNASTNRNVKIIFDAHEFSEEQESEQLLWRFLVRPFRRWVFLNNIHKISAMITVSKQIADLFKDRYSVNNIHVVRNSRFFVKNDFRPANENRVRIIYQGAAIRSRHLEDFQLLSEMLDDRFSIDLMLVDVDNRYFTSLKEKLKHIDCHKLRIIKAVDYSQLNEELNAYDIGIPALHAPNLNHQFALGGKFFDYVTAGLAIAVPPLPAYQEIINKFDLGLIPKDKNVMSLATLLNESTIMQINQYKMNSLNASYELSFDVEKKKIMDIYAHLIFQENN